jgi:hypothetical protein
MKTLALLTLSLTILASSSASFAEQPYRDYGGYRGKRTGENKKCRSPYDYRCSTSNGG